MLSLSSVGFVWRGFLARGMAVPLKARRAAASNARGSGMAAVGDAAASFRRADATSPALCPTYARISTADQDRGEK